MLILGKTSDDKGTQLEILVKTVLEEKGFTNLVFSQIGSGGSELDVVGDWVVPTLTGSRTLRIVCECKAHQSPQNMTDWLKFMGKVYIAQTERHEEVAGCFVALSGVNGNVSGSYSSYRLQKNNIELLGEQQVLDIAHKFFPLSTVDAAMETVRGFTERTIRSLEVAYYDRALYWLVLFDEGEYTLLSGDGRNLPSKKAEEIGSMVEGQVAATKLVNLQEEAEAIRRSILLQKKLIASFAERGPWPVSIEARQADSAKAREDEAASPLSSKPGAPHKPFAPLAGDFTYIVEQLQEKGWVELSETSATLGFVLDANQKSPFFVDITTFMLTGVVEPQSILDYIQSDFYKRHIDDDLIKVIQANQNGLPLSDEQKSDLLTLLRLTPLGVVQVINWQRQIAGREPDNNRFVNESSALLGASMLFNIVYQSLMEDFMTPAFWEHYTTHLGIREVETTLGILVKSHTEPVISGQTRVRHYIGDLAEQDGGGLILLAMPEGSPQPWEIAAARAQADLAAQLEQQSQPM